MKKRKAYFAAGRESEELRNFVNGLRDVLGLEPLAADGRSKTQRYRNLREDPDLHRFAGTVHAWPGDAVDLTGRRRSGIGS